MDIATIDLIKIIFICLKNKNKYKRYRLIGTYLFNRACLYDKYSKMFYDKRDKLYEKQKEQKR